MKMCELTTQDANYSYEQLSVCRVSYKLRESCRMLQGCGSNAYKKRQAKLHSDRIDREL